MAEGLDYRTNHGAKHKAGGSDDILSAPGAIGGTTPSTGAFTTVNALTLTAAATGFTVAGGSTSKTLTLDTDITASDLIDISPYSLELTGETTLTEAQTLLLHAKRGVVTNQGATGEVDINLDDLEYRVTFSIALEEAQNIEINVPTDEVPYLNGTAYTANWCIESDSVEGSELLVKRRKDSSGVWHYYFQTITGVWTCTGVGD